MIRSFDQRTADSLASRGFAVVDNVISERTASDVRAEIDDLHARGALQVNATHFVSKSASTTRLLKRNVFECELHTLSSTQRADIPSLCAIQADATIRALLNVYHPRFTLRDQALKAQLNTGSGGCFPIHVDSAQAVDARRVTALLYLNEATAGGALRVYPFPDPPVDIVPSVGRLVLLSATHMLHRVLPSFQQERYALTLWLSGDYRAQKRHQNGNEAPSGVDQLVSQLLLSAKVRALIARVVLADQWDASLRDAHPKEEAEAAILIHRTDRRKIVECLPHQITRMLPHHRVSANDVHNRVAQLLESPPELLQLLRNASAENQNSEWF